MVESVPEALLARIRAERPPPPPLSYATVADYCDSRDLFGGFARRAMDLKDQQRPWMLKALLTLTRPGSRLLEIGAGEPLVADLLARSGCRVTAVDPYDGGAGGPTELDVFRRRHPGVRFVPARFGPDTAGLDAGGYDLVYSISVLEHLPSPELAGLFAAVSRVSRPGARQLHTVDHVHAGAGAEHHRAMLEAVTRGMGLDAGELGPLLARAADDPETYWLSAEGHHRWRGGRAYADFPMRRCMAVQFSAPVGRA